MQAWGVTQRVAAKATCRSLTLHVRQVLFLFSGFGRQDHGRVFSTYDRVTPAIVEKLADEANWDRSWDALCDEPSVQAASSQVVQSSSMPSDVALDAEIARLEKLRRLRDLRRELADEACLNHPRWGRPRAPAFDPTRLC